MSYEVSQSTKDALQALLDTKQVMQALQFAENDQEEIIQRQMELALIPSPTFHEEKKAARFLEMFKEEGLENCHIDEYGNCIGIRRGTGGGKTLLVEGHLDTVFPMETELKITRENGVIHCPGIVDDTRGCVVLLSVIRALNVAGIKTKGDIQFVGTVQEEGMGSLGGMRYYLEHHPEIEGSISVDGPGYHGVTFEATGFKTYEVNFYGIGGHASGAFGKIANPLHAAARAVAKIADFQVPTDPRTTFAVTNFHAGSPASVKRNWINWTNEFLTPSSRPAMRKPRAGGKTPLPLIIRDTVRYRPAHRIHTPRLWRQVLPFQTISVARNQNLHTEDPLTAIWQLARESPLSVLGTATTIPTVILCVNILLNGKPTRAANRPCCLPCSVPEPKCRIVSCKNISM